MGKPRSKFSIGGYVRTTLTGSPYADVTGVIRDMDYSQYINATTGEPVDEWSWVYMVEFERGFSLPVMECFLRKARTDE